MGIKKRRVPIGIHRRLRKDLSDTAVAAAERQGYSLDDYRADRDTHGLAMDAILAAQVDELAVALLGTNHSIPESAPYLRALRMAMRDASRLGPQADALVAGDMKAAADCAVNLADMLRRMADTADVIAIGFGLRADDYTCHQQIPDFVASHPNG